MNIICDPDNMPGQELLEKMKEGAAICVEAEGIPCDRASASLTLVDPEEIRELNKTYRNVDKVTDVLSFPQYDDLDLLPDEGELLLGDVVICREQAEIQAEEFGHSVEREMVYLFVHSICHLLGYDHMEQEDKRRMRQKEESVMSQIRLER